VSFRFCNQLSRTFAHLFRTLSLTGSVPLPSNTTHSIPLSSSVSDTNNLPLPSERKIWSGADFLDYLSETLPDQAMRQYFRDLPGCVKNSKPSPENEKVWEDLKGKTLALLAKFCEELKLPIDLEHLSK
jgi:hypothetical protein